MSKHHMPRVIAVLCITFLAVSGGYNSLASRADAQPQAAKSSRFFLETGHIVKGPFLEYWEQYGGLMQLGYPISEEMRETSPVDGKTYTVQYFERAEF